MKSHNKAVLGFAMALAAVVMFGAQQAPDHLTLEGEIIFLVKCIPEALLAPLFFPLALCYNGCGFSDLLVGSPQAHVMPAFGSEMLGGLVRALLVGLAFWVPWMAEVISPSHLPEESEDVF